MTAHNAPPVYIVGDIHGQYEQLVGLLRGVGLVDERLDWAGGAALLWFIGDFFDRGPCGVASVDLVMRRQSHKKVPPQAVRCSPKRRADKISGS